MSHTIPQILSTHTAGVPLWAVGFIKLVAHGMVIQSVAQLGPINAPTAMVADPVTLNDMAGVLTKFVWFIKLQFDTGHFSRTSKETH